MRYGWLLTFAFLGWPQSDPPQPGWVAACQVTGVHDGDTVTVTVTRTYHIRLLDCYAPEVTGRQKADGIKSMLNMQKLALGRKGILFVPENQEDEGKSTSMSRFLGRIWINGVDVSAAQVEQGFAGATQADEDRLFGLRKEENGK